MHSHGALLLVLSAVAAQPCSRFTVDLARGKRIPVTLHATFQVQAHPLLTRASPLHDALWEAVETLAAGTQLVRYQAWDPYPSYAVPLLHRPDANSSNGSAAYNFSLLDPFLLDFEAKVLRPRQQLQNQQQQQQQQQVAMALLNLPVSPAWMWEGTGNVSANANPASIEHPFDRYGNAGTVPTDPSLGQLATYFGKVASWYLAGGLVHDDGEVICSGHGAMPFTYYEVLNEPSYAHNVSSPALYIEYYDRIVLAVRREVARAQAAGCSGGGMGPGSSTDPATIKFVGIEQGRWEDLDAARQFFNKSNHRWLSDPPMDAIAWHWYAHLPASLQDASTAASNRSSGKGSSSGEGNAAPTPVPADSDFEAFFPQVDAFVDKGVAPLVAIRDAEAPACEILLNEFGVELPPHFVMTLCTLKGDIDSPAGVGPTAEPKTWARSSFQAAAAATFAYAYGKVAALHNVQNLGQSQFVGHSWQSAEPSPMKGLDREYYPGLSMMNWTSAAPLARYRVVAMLTAAIVPGRDAYVAGGVFRSATPGGNEPGNAVAAFAFDHQSNSSSSSKSTASDCTKRVLVVNKGSNRTCVVFSGPDVCGCNDAGNDRRGGGGGGGGGGSSKNSCACVPTVRLLQADGTPDKVVQLNVGKAGSVQFALEPFQVAMVSL